MLKIERLMTKDEFRETPGIHFKLDAASIIPIYNREYHPEQTTSE